MKEASGKNRVASGKVGWVRLNIDHALHILRTAHHCGVGAVAACAYRPPLTNFGTFWEFLTVVAQGKRALGVVQACNNHQNLQEQM